MGPIAAAQVAKHETCSHSYLFSPLFPIVNIPRFPSSSFGPAPGRNAQLLEGYRSGGRRRCVPGGIRGDDFNRVFSEYTVSGDRAAGTKADILQDAVEVNVVTDVGLDVEIVDGLGPLDLHLGAAVAKTVRAQIGGSVRRCVVIWIGRQGGDGDGVAER